MGGSREFFSEEKSKCFNHRWIFSKGWGRATIFYVHTVRNKKNIGGGDVTEFLLPRWIRPPREIYRVYACKHAFSFALVNQVIILSW